jgi:hypothetical protein
MDNEVLILTNYRTWTNNEFSFYFPPPPPVTPKSKKKRKHEQDPTQLILRNDFEISYQFSLTSDLFDRWNVDHDYAVRFEASKEPVSYAPYSSRTCYVQC